MLYTLAFKIGSSNAKISECMDLSLGSVKKIRKELNESNGDYEGTAAQKPHSVRSEKKRALKFLGETQVMIDNDHSKSIRSLARNMGVSELLIRQVEHEDIQYFSYEMRKSKFLSPAMKYMIKDRAAKLLNKLKHPLKPNMLWFFSDEKNFCRDQMVNSEKQPQACSVLTRYPDWEENQIPSSHDGVWGSH